jgi:hypothetical protein
LEIGTPPVLGSAEAEALAAEAEALAAEAEALAVAVAVAPTLMSRPAATLWKQASTWFWLTPSSCATALKSSASASWYCPIAAWIWSQSTYWTLPATAVWAKAGAAAASTMASIAANNITFLNFVTSLHENYLTCRIFSSSTPNVNTIYRIFYYFLKIS